MGEVKLLTAWPSPFSYRVIWALKLKGIPYEHLEENVDDKSPLLLRSNPVYNKIPVLLHGDKPICESTLIIEYLDEVWPQVPLFPSDSLERATARFWIKFIEDKGPSMWKIFRNTGDELEKAVKDTLEMLKTIEEEALIGEKKFFGGDKIVAVDIAYGMIAHWLPAIEELLGLKLFDAHKFPKLHSWSINFKGHPLIKENLPDYQKMLTYFKSSRETILTSA